MRESSRVTAGGESATERGDAVSNASRVEFCVDNYQRFRRGKQCNPGHAGGAQTALNDREMQTCGQLNRPQGSDRAMNSGIWPERRRKEENRQNAENGQNRPSASDSVEHHCIYVPILPQGVRGSGRTKPIPKLP
jgi:hypothetical protein